MYDRHVDYVLVNKEVDTSPSLMYLYIWITMESFYY